MKRILTGFFGAIIAILANPLMLEADSGILPHAPSTQVQTVIETSVEPEAATQEAQATAAYAVAPANNLSAAFPAADLAANLTAAPSASEATYTITMVMRSAAEYEATSQNLSYADIYRFQKLVYAHNSANLFGGLSALAPGQTFSLSESGITRQYRVAAQAVYANTPTGLDGDPELMGEVAYEALGHSVALMTCAGIPYGNGNSTARLVVYGDEI